MKHKSKWVLNTKSKNLHFEEIHKLKKYQEVLGSSRELLFIKLLLREVLVPECCDADEMSKVSLVRDKSQEI